MSNPRAMVVVACSVLLASCATGQSAEQDLSHADIAHVANVKSSFGPEYKVTSVGPTGIDPRVLGSQTVPPGMTFDPADCAKAASQQLVPAGVKGNMAATTAEGEGNRFIAIASRRLIGCRSAIQRRTARRSGSPGRGCAVSSRSP